MQDSTGGGEEEQYWGLEDEEETEQVHMSWPPVTRDGGEVRGLRKKLFGTLTQLSQGRLRLIRWPSLLLLLLLQSCSGKPPPRFTSRAIFIIPYKDKASRKPLFTWPSSVKSGLPMLCKFTYAHWLFRTELAWSSMLEKFVCCTKMPASWDLDTAIRYSQ